VGGLWGFDVLWLADYQDGGARDDVALLAVRVGPI
jgi:hypothetical protein